MVCAGCIYFVYFSENREILSVNTDEMNSSDSGCHIQNPECSFLGSCSLLLYYKPLAVFFNRFS